MNLINILFLSKVTVTETKDYTMFFIIIGAAIVVSIATAVHDKYLKKKKFESFWHNKSANKIIKIKKARKKKRQKYVNYKTAKPTIIYDDKYKNDFTQNHVEDMWNKLK